MITVTKKSTRPSSTNAERYSVWSASVNSFAITDAMVLLGPNISSLKLGAILVVLPISMVTAIVSPSARPNDIQWRGESYLAASTIPLSNSRSNRTHARDLAACTRPSFQ